MNLKNKSWIKDFGISSFRFSGGIGGGEDTEPPTTTKGDISGFSTTYARVPVGSNGQRLTANSAEATGLQWETPTDEAPPTTTKGDLSGFSTTQARVPIGSNDQVLTADSTTALGLAWKTPVDISPPTTTKGDISGFSTTQARIPIGSNDQVLTADSTTALGLAWKTQANPTESFVIACSDEETDLETGTKVTFRIPYAFTITAVRASLTTAPTGSTLVVDINENGTSILSTKISIDVSETTSTTAATPPVILDSSLADDSSITIDIDQIGSSNAGTGLKVTIIGNRT